MEWIMLVYFIAILRLFGTSNGRIFGGRLVYFSRFGMLH
jgi:hypothetical protein